MPTQFTPAELTAIPLVLSPPRFQKYLTSADNDPARALALYRWNSQVSAAFLHPLHICEVALRNAISTAIEGVYGPSWPWSHSFHQSLPNPPPPAFSPRREITAKSGRYSTTGKVVADVNFAFWVSMLTSRHDSRIWNRYFSAMFPNFLTLSSAVGRQELYSNTDDIRKFRNRVAHHEPIFHRMLHGDLDRLVAVIKMRCGVTAAWVMRTQSVTRLIAEDPRIRETQTV